MNENSVAEALRALVTSGSKKSETARLRLVFDEVERAFAAGISRESMLETLHAQGFKMTLRGFDTVLYRLRKERESGKVKKPEVLRVHASIEPPPAAAPQVFTPKGEAETPSPEDEDLSLLSPKERRERRADQFIKTESQSTNPLLKSILKKDQNK